MARTDRCRAGCVSWVASTSVSTPWLPTARGFICLCVRLSPRSLHWQRWRIMLKLRGTGLDKAVLPRSIVRSLAGRIYLAASVRRVGRIKHHRRYAGRVHVPGQFHYRFVGIVLPFSKYYPRYRPLDCFEIFESLHRERERYSVASRKPPSQRNAAFARSRGGMIFWYLAATDRTPNCRNPACGRCPASSPKFSFALATGLAAARLAAACFSVAGSVHHNWRRSRRMKNGLNY
jgi:hypothetical protein